MSSSMGDTASHIFHPMSLEIMDSDGLGETMRTWTSITCRCVIRLRMIKGFGPKSSVPGGTLKALHGKCDRIAWGWCATSVLSQ